MHPAWPTKALELKRDTLARSMATIESRINGLGLAVIPATAEELTKAYLRARKI